MVDGFQRILKEDKEDEMIVIASNILDSYGEDVSKDIGLRDSTNPQPLDWHVQALLMYT